MKTWSIGPTSICMALSPATSLTATWLPDLPTMSFTRMRNFLWQPFLWKTCA